MTTEIKRIKDGEIILEFKKPYYLEYEVSSGGYSYSTNDWLETWGVADTLEELRTIFGYDIISLWQMYIETKETNDDDNAKEIRKWLEDALVRIA